jgi:hypothetical protein
MKEKTKLIVLNSISFITVILGLSKLASLLSSTEIINSSGIGDFFHYSTAGFFTFFFVPVPRALLVYITAAYGIVAVVLSAISFKKRGALNILLVISILVFIGLVGTFIIRLGE